MRLGVYIIIIVLIGGGISTEKSGVLNNYENTGIQTKFANLHPQTKTFNSQSIYTATTNINKKTTLVTDKSLNGTLTNIGKINFTSTKKVLVESPRLIKIEKGKNFMKLETKNIIKTSLTSNMSNWKGLTSYSNNFVIDSKDQYISFKKFGGVGGFKANFDLKFISKTDRFLINLNPLKISNSTNNDVSLSFGLLDNGSIKQLRILYRTSFFSAKNDSTNIYLLKKDPNLLNYSITDLVSLTSLVNPEKLVSIELKFIGDPFANFIANFSEFNLFQYPSKISNKQVNVSPWFNITEASINKISINNSFKIDYKKGYSGLIILNLQNNRLINYNQTSQINYGRINSTLTFDIEFTSRGYRTSSLILPIHKINITDLKIASKNIIDPINYTWSGSTVSISSVGSFSIRIKGLLKFVTSSLNDNVIQGSKTMISNIYGLQFGKIFNRTKGNTIAWFGVNITFIIPLTWVRGLIKVYAVNGSGFGYELNLKLNLDVFKINVQKNYQYNPTKDNIYNISTFSYLPYKKINEVKIKTLNSTSKVTISKNQLKLNHDITNKTKFQVLLQITKLGFVSQNISLDFKQKVLPLSWSFNLNRISNDNQIFRINLYIQNFNKFQTSFVLEIIISYKIISQTSITSENTSLIFKANLADNSQIVIGYSYFKSIKLIDNHMVSNLLNSKYATTSNQFTSSFNSTLPSNQGSNFLQIISLITIIPLTLGLGSFYFKKRIKNSDFNF